MKAPFVVRPSPSCVIAVVYPRSLDLMWSDPDDIENWAVSPRGAGWLFGGSVVKEVRMYASIYPPALSDRISVQPCQ